MDYFNRIYYGQFAGRDENLYNWLKISST